MNSIRTLMLAYVLTALAAGCDNDIYVMSEIYKIEGEERVSSGGGCMLAISQGLGGGSAGSGLSDAANDFGVTTQTDGDTFVVVVTSGTVELERREYSEKFLRSGERDEFSVTTRAGRRYELAFWGGDTCDTSHLPRDADGSI